MRCMASMRGDFGYEPLERQGTQHIERVMKNQILARQCLAFDVQTLSAYSYMDNCSQHACLHANGIHACKHPLPCQA